MRRAAAGLLVVIMLAVNVVHGKAERNYSISVDVSYGESKSRVRYLDEIDRALGSWLAATGPFGAPVDRGEADLHLQLTMHAIEIDRRYPQTSPEGNVLFDTERVPTETWSTLFDVTFALLDPTLEERVIVEKRMNLFNSQGYSEFITDPRQRSWDVNVEFLIDRIESFLKKKKKKIRRHLEEHPREPVQEQSG